MLTLTVRTRIAVGVRLCCAAIVVFAAAACANRPEQKTDTVASLPIGLLDRHDGGFTSGIYTSTSDSDPDCCWIAGDASFQVREPADGRNLVVTVSIPDLDVFHRRPQSVRVETAIGAKKLFTGLGPGIHALSVPLPPARRQQVLDVTLKSGYTFTPRREGINGDTRPLALYLKAAIVR